MPEKFKMLYGYNGRRMFAISLKESDHIKITSKMNSTKYGINKEAERRQKWYF